MLGLSSRLVRYLDDWILTSLPSERNVRAKKNILKFLSSAHSVIEKADKRDIPLRESFDKMPPRTRKAATASSSNAAGTPNKIAVAAEKNSIDIPDKVLEDSQGPDNKPKIVVDEDDEDMEVFELSDQDGTGTHAPNKDEQRALYAVGGGGYNALKTFQGQVYSGMAIGGSHTWNYDQGVWKETKVEPDRWEIDYATTKRRARNAPKGSGVPVGTEYHWFIVGHQV